MKQSGTAADDRRLLLAILEEAFDQPTWNGTNLRSSISRVTAEAAGWCPPHSRHGIADIVLHCAYWKYAIRRRLRGDRRGSFPLKGSNWFAIGRPLSPQRWSEIIAILDGEHERLCEAVRGATRQLRYTSAGGREWARRLFGVAIHDAYHTGQIHLIKKMWMRSR